MNDSYYDEADAGQGSIEEGESSSSGESGDAGLNYDKRGYESSSTAHREVVGQAAIRLKRKQLLAAQQKEQLEAKFKRNMKLDFKSQVMQDAKTDLKFE